MRCKACNKLMTQTEEKIIYEFGEHIELCSDCMDSSTIEHYAIEGMEDDVTKPFHLQ